MPCDSHNFSLSGRNAGSVCSSKSLNTLGSQHLHRYWLTWSSVFYTKTVHLTAILVPPFSLVLIGFKKKNVLPTVVSTIPPWLLKRPNCNFSLCCYDKTATNPEVFKRKFFELRSEFSHHVEIFTRMELEQLPLLHPALSKQFACLTMLVFLLPKFMHWTWR